MKITYKKIVEAIYKKAKEEKLDVRDLIREWARLFEESRVEGFSREEFLDMCIEVKDKYSPRTRRRNSVVSTSVFPSLLK